MKTLSLIGVIVIAISSVNAICDEKKTPIDKVRLVELRDFDTVQTTNTSTTVKKHTQEGEIEAKRLENQAKQKEWEDRRNYAPIVNFNTKNLREIVLKNKADFDPVKDKEQEECRSWKNSYVLDPTPEKSKYIKDNCQ